MTVRIPLWAIASVVYTLALLGGAFGISYAVFEWRDEEPAAVDLSAVERRIDDLEQQSDTGPTQAEAAEPTETQSPQPPPPPEQAPRATSSNPFDFIDDHSGSFVALATLALVAVTGVYVFLTNRLVRAQQIGAKREIVEKIYRPINGELEIILWGDSPGLRWDELKEKEPFLAFHHFIPPGIRAGLDELAKDCNELLATHEELTVKVAQSALAVEHEREFDHPVAEVGYTSHKTGYSASLSIFLLPLPELPEILRHFEIDFEAGLSIWMSDGNDTVVRRDIDKDALSQTVEQTRRVLVADADSRELFERYRLALRRVDDLYRGIGHEITTASQV